MSRAAPKGLTSPKRKVLKRFTAQKGAWQIALANDDFRERQTYLQLRRLLECYDLRKWIFTRKILIDSGAKPHSHHVLTLGMKYLHSRADT